MEKFKQIIKILLNPKPIVIFLSIPITIALMIYVFVLEHENEPSAYLSYLISAYSLIIVCIWLYKNIKKVKSKFYSIASKNQYFNKYESDISFHTKVSLSKSLAFNFLYALFKLGTGIYYRSTWFITIAVYYILLVIMRYLLVFRINGATLGKNISLEYKRYKICGRILLLLDIVLTGVVVLIIKQNQGFEYAGYLIYVMAMYTFYTVISAFINVIKYRKSISPIISAEKIINLTQAMISMLSLEVAMLIQFDTTGDLLFKNTMIGITGFVVCIINSAMAIYMIFKSHKYLKQSK